MPEFVCLLMPDCAVLSGVTKQLQVDRSLEVLERQEINFLQATQLPCLAQAGSGVQDWPIGVARTGDDLDTESNTASLSLRTQFLGPDSTDACPPFTP